MVGSCKTQRIKKTLGYCDVISICGLLRISDGLVVKNTKDKQILRKR